MCNLNFNIFILMSSSIQFSPQRSSLLESSKIAFLQYVTDRKQPLRNYQQRSIFWDREHLYNQNLMLRNKIKQMSQNNTKTKTQLLRTQKQLVNLSVKKTNSKVIRSFSAQQIGKDRQLSVIKWRVDALKQQQHAKHLLTLKQSIRKLKQEMQRLKNENLQLKKSIKYTRIGQMQAQNRQLQEQILRVGKVAINANKMHEQLLKSYLKQKDDMEHRVRKEVEARAQINRQLKRLKAQIQQANNKSTQRSSKKLLSRLTFLQQENSQLKGILLINMKNNSELKFTLQNYRKNNQFKQTQPNNSQFTRLDYSVSVLSEFPTSDHKLNSSAAKGGLTSDLTSLELLTPNSSHQDFRSPQKKSALKFQQKIHQEPHNEEQQDNRPLVSLQKSIKSVNLEPNLFQAYQTIAKREKQSQSQYQYILQDF